MEEMHISERMAKIDNVAGKIFFVLTALSVITSFYVLIITTMDVVGRQLGHSIFGAVQTSEIALSLLVMCTLPIVTMYNAHIKVDLVMEKMSPKVQKVFVYINLVFSAFVLAVMSYSSYVKTWKIKSLGTCSEAFGIPFWPIYLMISIMLLASAICAVYNIFHYSMTGILISATTFDSMKKNKKESEKEEKA